MFVHYDCIREAVLLLCKVCVVQESRKCLKQDCSPDNFCTLTSFVSRILVQSVAIAAWFWRVSIVNRFWVGILLPVSKSPLLSNLLWLVRNINNSKWHIINKKSSRLYNAVWRQKYIWSYQKINYYRNSRYKVSSNFHGPLGRKVTTEFCVSLKAHNPKSREIFFPVTAPIEIRTEMNQRWINLANITWNGKSATYMYSL